MQYMGSGSFYAQACTEEYAARAACGAGAGKKSFPIPNSEKGSDWEVKKKYAFLRSMDYSGTTIMPLPRIKRGEKEWEIWRYEMEEERGREKEDRLEETEECVEFYAGESGECVICWLREVVE